LAALDHQCQAGAHRDRAPGFLRELGRDGALLDDRVAPLVERDQLGEQLRAVAVRVAQDRVDSQVLAHGPAPVGSSGSEWVAEQRPARWSWISSAKTRSALSTNRTAPSGWAHAPRRAICALKA